MLDNGRGENGLTAAWVMGIYLVKRERVEEGAVLRYRFRSLCLSIAQSQVLT